MVLGVGNGVDSAKDVVGGEFHVEVEDEAVGVSELINDPQHPNQPINTPLIQLIRRPLLSHHLCFLPPRIHNILIYDINLILRIKYRFFLIL